MTVVDSHLHVNLNGFSLKDIIKYLDREKIDCCWLLSWEESNPGPWPYQHLSVEDLYEAYLKYPSRIIPFYAPDPHRDNAAQLLESWHQKGIRGCGELKATLNWDSAEVKKLLSTARKLKMPVVFHMEESKNYYVPYSNAIYDRIIYYSCVAERKIYRIPRNLLRILINHYQPLRTRIKQDIFPGYMLDFASLEATLQEYPEINFIAHGPLFWKQISGDAARDKNEYPQGEINGKGIIWRLLEEYPNLYADISAGSGMNALTRDSENAKTFLSLFENKLLYGTDNVMKGQREFLNSLGLSREAYQKVYGENACQILKCR